MNECLTFQPIEHEDLTEETLVVGGHLSWRKSLESPVFAIIHMHVVLLLDSSPGLAAPIYVGYVFEATADLLLA